MAVIHFNEQGLDKALSAPGVVLVDFWAGWCNPCKMLAPVVEKLAEQYEGKAVVGKADVDEERALAMRYRVMSIPTVLIFKDGKEVSRKVGVQPDWVYTSALDAYL